MNPPLKKQHFITKLTVCFIQQFTMHAQAYSYTTLNKQPMYHSRVADKKIVAEKWVSSSTKGKCCLISQLYFDI